MKRLRSTFTLVSLVMSFALVCTLLPAKAWASTAVPSSFTSSSTSITGTIDLSAYTTSSGQEVTRDGKTYYEGNVGGSVEAGDLFAGAYQKYESTFAGKKIYAERNTKTSLCLVKGRNSLLQPIRLLSHPTSWLILLPSPQQRIQILSAR